MLNNIKVYIPSEKENWLMLFLCIIAFSATFLTAKLSFDNAFVIYVCELLFMILYIVIFRAFPPFIKIFKENKLVGFVLSLWAISISYSLYNSPLNLFNQYYAIFRYLQTITHVIMFVFLWDLFYRFRPSLRFLFYLIPLSTIVIVGAFLIEWFIVSSHVGNNVIATIWFNNPPFNSHIRHTGYQASAALGFFFVFFIERLQIDYRQIINFIMLLTLWGFLFWLGGRGVILSILITVLFIFLVMTVKKIERKTFLLSTMAAIVLGVLLSEWASIGSWNGVVSAFEKSVKAENINQLSTDRIELWKTSWESVNNYLAFGLGPQGYVYMPNRIRGVHPHNVLLQFIVEWGICGTILFLFLLVKGFWTGFKRNVLDVNGDFNKYALAAGAVISILSLNALTDGTYYHPQPSLYLAIAFAIWIIPPSKRKIENV